MLVNSVFFGKIKKKKFRNSQSKRQDFKSSTLDRLVNTNKKNFRFLDSNITTKTKKKKTKGSAINFNMEIFFNMFIIKLPRIV